MAQDKTNLSEIIRTTPKPFKTNITTVKNDRNLRSSCRPSRPTVLYKKGYRNKSFQLTSLVLIIKYSSINRVKVILKLL